MNTVTQMILENYFGSDIIFENQRFIYFYNNNLERDVKYLIFSFISSINVDEVKTDFLRFESKIYSGEIEGCVYIFEDVDQRNKILLEIKKTQNKSFIQNFNSAKTIFKSGYKPFVFDIDDMHNYLEFSDDDKRVTGYIYNVSVYDFFNLYSKAGSALFKNNIRYGANNAKLFNTFKSSFNSYINGEENSNNLFWFKHNGVSLMIKNSIKKKSKGIEVIPYEINIINGAQTVTTIVKVIESMRKEQQENMEKIKKIKVKAIFITDGTDRYMDDITLGLNAQLAVDEYDKVGNSEQLKRLNKILEKHKFYIRKRYEISDVPGQDIMEFVKSYLIVKGTPGAAKNFPKSKVEKEYTEILEYAKNSNDSFKSMIEFIKKMDLIDRFLLDEKKDYNTDEYQKNQIFSKSNYYFKAYLYRVNKQFKEEELKGYLEEYFEDVLAQKDILQSENPDNTFKKDILFNKILDVHLYKEKNSILDLREIITDEVLNEIVDRIEKDNSGDKARKNRIVKEVLKEKNRNDNVRTITFRNLMPTESFPLPVETFNEIISKYQEWNKKNNVFEKSAFYNELSQIENMFVFYENQEGDKIIGLDYIRKLDFSNHKHEAQDVFYDTVRKFNEANSDFIKSGEKKGFHIRPKALNKDDSFEFTDGEFITKQTFWANKETIKDVIEKSEKKVYERTD